MFLIKNGIKLKNKKVRKRAKDITNTAKSDLFNRLQKKLEEAIRKGETSFHMYEPIDLIKADLEAMGYTVTQQTGEYNSTQYEIKF